MKRFVINGSPAIILMVIISIAGSSCQKSFDPNSYEPEQVFNGYSASSQVSASNLVAYWSFDDNLTDSVSNTSGTNNGTSFTAGIKGKAMQGALNSYVLFPNTSQIKSVESFTLAYWVKTTPNLTGIQTTVDFVNPTGFWGNFDNFFDGQSDAGSTYKFHLMGSAGAQEAWLDQFKLTTWGTWLNIGLTYSKDSSTFTWYLNGVQQGSSVKAGFGTPDLILSPSIVFGTVQFMTVPNSTTGTDPQPWASYLTGALDEVRMYSKALTAADMNALYQLQNLGR